MPYSEAEVPIAVTHLTHLPGITQLPVRPVSYFHLLFDTHELVLSNGTGSESFQPVQRSLEEMDADQRRELFTILPALAAEKIDYPPARVALKGFEMNVLLVKLKRRSKFRLFNQVDCKAKILHQPRMRP